MISIPVVIRASDEYLTIRSCDAPQVRGGKPASAALLKPVKPNTKRAAILAWFHAPCSTRRIKDAMTHFGVSRQNIFAHWAVLNRVHGFGYALVGDKLDPIIPGDPHGS